MKKIILVLLFLFVGFSDAFALYTTAVQIETVALGQPCLIYAKSYDDLWAGNYSLQQNSVYVRCDMEQRYITGGDAADVEYAGWEEELSYPYYYRVDPADIDDGPYGTYDDSLFCVPNDDYGAAYLSNACYFCGPDPDDVSMWECMDIDCQIMWKRPDFSVSTYACTQVGRTQYACGDGFYGAIVENPNNLRCTPCPDNAMCDGGDESAEFECDPGFYGSASTGKCTPCPEIENYMSYEPTSNRGAKTASECYLVPDIDYHDGTGYFDVEENCYWDNTP